jgi:glyoxylase-like metal-dependent hydrolase (beta-lactamase superfamily II)
MRFRQLLDPETSTWTYLLGDEATGEAILIDPVLEQLERDRTLLAELSLRLVATLETHVHADHVTAGGRLREALGSRVVVGSAAGVENADRALADGEVFQFGGSGGLELEARATPGHTAGCTSFVCHAERIAFTGDTLLIRGCGRTDFQQGDARTLFASVREKIFTLPDETLLYPGHDYRGRTVTTVAEEKAFNPRLGLARGVDDFTRIMAGLDLAYPKRIDVAVPANLVSGLIEKPRADERPVAAAMEQLGRQDAEHWQGMDI